MATGRLPDPNTAPVTAKGDLYTYSTVPAKLAVGSNGETLVADSSTATGLKWAKDPVADLVTTAGDTLYATAADTLTRLGIGTAGQVLTVNSGATAPEWKTPASGTTFSGVKCKKSGSQTIVDGTETALTFDQEDFDTDGFHSTATNTSRITIPSGKNGYYLFIATVLWNGNSTGYRSVNLKKNGSNLSPVNKQEISGQGSTEFGQIISFVVSAVATDYFESFVLQNSGGNLGVSSIGTFFQAIYLGA